MKFSIPLLLALFLLGGCLEKNSEGDIPSTMVVEQAYAFATMPGQATGAAFMVIKNTAAIDDNLVDAKSKLAEITEIHENSIDPDDNTMMMRKIANIMIPANGEAVLEPTGKHIMLLKLKEPLTLGATTPITLMFEKAGEIIVDVEIIQPGSKPGMELEQY
jgi:copper(I)-binding protein